MRSSSERANLPRWKGQDGFFEIWFVVVFEPRSRRGYWLRYTTFAPTPGRGDERRAMLWAAAYQQGAPAPAISVKSIFDDDDYDGGDDKTFLIRVGPAAMGNDFCRGESKDAEHAISWQLHYRPKTKEARRGSPLLEALPLSSRAHHANCEIEVDGWVTVDGYRQELRGAPGIQMHIYGTDRLEELFWLYAPAFEEDPRAVLEVTSARTHRRIGRVPLAAIAPLWLSSRRGVVDHTGLVASLKSKVSRPRAQVLDVRSQSRREMVRVRAFAPVEGFVGYRYREPSGRELCVAQSDIASCLVEVFRPTGLDGRWSPASQLVSRGSSALEFHAPEPMDRVEYVEWEATGPGPRRLPSSPPPSPPPERAVDQAGVSGLIRPLPEPLSIYALGMTYRKHIEEAGADRRNGPEVSRKSHDSWLPVGDTVAMPDSAAILSALDGLEPGLAAELEKRFGAMVAMMDYEVELGMLLLDDVSEGDLRRPSFHPPLGFFLVNDLTARSCQIIGEGQPHPMAYCGLAKSFPGFSPVTPAMWVPEVAGAMPRVTLRTRVNGALRQEAHTSELILTPREMLLRILATTKRELRRGDAVLTGTPRGVAFRVSRRRVGRWLLGRFGRLAAAMDAYARSDRFLLPGDLVEIDAGPLGRRSVTITL